MDSTNGNASRTLKGVSSITIQEKVQESSTLFNTPHAVGNDGADN